MKKIVTSAVLLLLIQGINAQIAQFLEINNIRARVSSISEPMFMDNGNASFEAPKGINTHSIFSAFLWVGGIHNNNLHLSANYFDSDYQPGPIMDSVSYSSQISNWDRVWKINQSEIIYHIQNYMNSTYVMPLDFSTWPAHGDTTIGQSYYLAPFVDFNNNGVYDPDGGDYPKIKGEQCIYYVYNDDKAHDLSTMNKMKIEIHCMAYSFDCQQDSALFNTIFLNYRIINRSTNTYYNSYLGFWTDLDIGAYVDDRIGCDIARSSYYGYNGDNYDSDFSGVFGYLDLLPAQSVTFLAGAKCDEDGTDNPICSTTPDAIDSNGIVYSSSGYGFNDSIVDNERFGLTNFLYHSNGTSPAGNPSEAGFYQYMKGRFQDSTPIMYNNVIYNYMFPGDTDPLCWGTAGDTCEMWDEISQGLTPSDRRAVGSSGAFTFESQTEEELDIAFVFARAYSTPNDNIAPITIMKDRIDNIRSYFESNNTPCGTPFTINIQESSISDKVKFNVYPNPSKEILFIQTDNLVSEYEVILTDISGKIILRKENIKQMDVSDFANGFYFITIPELNHTEKIQVIK